ALRALCGRDAPARQPERAAAPSADERADQRADATPARALRVLLVEDNPVNRLVARRTLERMGHAVVEAVDGRAGIDAWRSASSAPIDLVLMDCQMPVLDGFEATRAIRALERHGARVPIIAITANALAGDRERCLAAGMDDYVSKPFRAAELEQAIARVLSSRAELDAA
ncbi:MAG: response regulator, partial [Planctomycetota bacterium]